MHLRVMVILLFLTGGMLHLTMLREQQPFYASNDEHSEGVMMTTSLPTAPPVVGLSPIFPNETQYTMDLARQAVRPAQWSCRSDGGNTTSIGREVGNGNINRRTIFSFVHVFKASGSSIRDFLLRLGGICHRGVAVLIHCTDVEWKTVVEGRDWEPCQQKVQLQRNGSVIVGSTEPLQRINNSILETELDVFGGHFKLGVGDKLQANVRYLTFLREPMSRFVSSKVYTNPDLTQKEIVRKIKKAVRDERRHGKYYMRVANYLLTPFQRKPNDVKAKARQVVRNLVKYNVIVGLTEDMSASMEILRDIFDKDRKLAPLFKMYGLDGSVETAVAERSTISRTTMKVKNKSHLSSSAVLQELSEDEKFMKLFSEYVKYEGWIFDNAVAMHRMQHEIVTE